MNTDTKQMGQTMSDKASKVQEVIDGIRSLRNRCYQFRDDCIKLNDAAGVARWTERGIGYTNALQVALEVELQDE